MNPYNLHLFVLYLYRVCKGELLYGHESAAPGLTRRHSTAPSWTGQGNGAESSGGGGTYCSGSGTCFPLFTTLPPPFVLAGSRSTMEALVSLDLAGNLLALEVVLSGLRHPVLLTAGAAFSCQNPAQPTP